MAVLKYWDGAQYVPLLGGIDQATADARYVNITGDTMTGALTLSGAPTVNLHAATKQYVDTTALTQAVADPLYVNVGGDTMTGLLTLSANPSSNLHAATKQYVDTNSITQTAADTRYVNVTGDTMTGPLLVPASIAGAAPLRMPHGTAPSSPVNGDMWTTSAGVYARINGATVGPFGLGGGLSQATADGLYVNVTGDTMTGQLEISGAAGTDRGITFSTNTVDRWGLGASSTAEGGIAAGSDLLIARYNNSGVYLGTALSLDRSNGAATFENVVYSSGFVTAGGGVQAGGGVVATGGNVTTNAGYFVPGTNYGVFWASNDLLMVPYGAGTLGLLNAAGSAFQTFMCGYLNPQNTITTSGGNSIPMNVQAPGIQYTGFTYGGGASARIGLRWATPNIIGGVDNVNTCVLGTVSARKWKAAISTAKGSLAKIEKLRPVEYTPKDASRADGFLTNDDGSPAPTGPRTGKRHHGLVADEVKRVLPSVVAEGATTDGDTVNYIELVPILVGAIQELSAEIKALKAQLATVAA